MKILKKVKEIHTNPALARSEHRKGKRGKCNAHYKIVTRVAGVPGWLIFCHAPPLLPVWRIGGAG